MGHLVGGRDENQISNKTETGEGEETEEEEEKMLLRTDGTDEHGNVGILSKKGCWKAKMGNKNLLKSDLLF